MGNSYSSGAIYYTGGDDGFSLNRNNLKDVENKLVEFLNTNGFVSSGVQDFNNYIKDVIHKTQPGNYNKDIADNKHKLVDGVKSYLRKGLNLNSINDSTSDSEVLSVGYSALNDINSQTNKLAREDYSKINSNVQTLRGMTDVLKHNMSNVADSQLKSAASNVIYKLDEHSNYLDMLSKSTGFSDLVNDDSDIRPSMSSISADNSAVDYINKVAKTANKINTYRDVRKLYDDDKLMLNSNAIKELAVNHNLSKNMSSQDMSKYIQDVYKILDSRESKVGGGRSRHKDNLLRLNNWGKRGGYDNIKVGGNKMSLQNKLVNKLGVSRANRNSALIKGANTLSEKLNALSQDILQITSKLKTLDVVQLRDLEIVFKKFLYFGTFKYKHIYLILLDYFIDMQSVFIKQDFITKLNSLIVLLEKAVVIIPELKETAAKLANVIEFINTQSTNFEQTYGMTKISTEDVNVDTKVTVEDSGSPYDFESGSGNLPLSDPYDIRINVDIDEIPDLSIINTGITKSVYRLLYSIRLTIYFKELGDTNDNKNAEYNELVGRSIGAELDKIKEDYTTIINKLTEFEHTGASSEFKGDKALSLHFPITIIPVPVKSNDGVVKYEYCEIKKIFMYLPTTPPTKETSSNVRDHRAWGRSDPNWVDDETLRGVNIQAEAIHGDNLRRMLLNYKEFFINYYESVIGLYLVAQAIDIYLMNFTDRIKKTPEIIDKLDTLLSSSKIASILHSNKSLDKLVNVFDPNNYNMYSRPHDNTVNIDEWCSGKATSTIELSNKHPSSNTGVDPVTGASSKNINPYIFREYFCPQNTVHTVFDNKERAYAYDNSHTNIDDNIINKLDDFNRRSSIISCGAGACDEVRPMIDLIFNRVPDNEMNRGGLHNRHWSTTPGKLDLLGKLINEYSMINEPNAIDVNADINHSKDEKDFHSMGSSYYEKYKPDINNKSPIQKMKELKEFYKNNTTLMNVLSLFFSMLGIDENTKITLSPKTIQEYLTNFMCWGSYQLTNVPSTVDINIGNAIPLINDNAFSTVATTDYVFGNDNAKNIGYALFCYFVSVADGDDESQKLYKNMFDLTTNIVETRATGSAPNFGQYGSIANDNPSWPNARPLSYVSYHDRASINFGGVQVTQGYSVHANGAILYNGRDIATLEHRASEIYGILPRGYSISNMLNHMVVNKGNEALIPYWHIINNKYYTGTHYNNIILNKLAKTMSLMNRNTPIGLVNLVKDANNGRLLIDDLIAHDVVKDHKIICNVNNPLIAGINDNLSVFDKSYSAMNIFDTNVRVTLIHSNQLSEFMSSKYVNSIQYKTQNMYSNIVKSIIGKILTVIGLYDLNDYTNNKPWRTYIMDTTRLTLGGIDIKNVIREDYAEFYIRIPLLLKFYKTIFYDVSQSDDNIKSRLLHKVNETVKILPEFDPPFDSLIKHYFMYSGDNTNESSNKDSLNITFNKQMYMNINVVVDHFSKMESSSTNRMSFIAKKLVKEINQKYGLLFNSDLTLYKNKIAKYFGMNSDYVTSLYDTSTSMLLYENDDLLSSMDDNQHELPSQKYSNFKNAYKHDSNTPQSTFSSKSYYDNIHDFRKFIQSILTDSINDKNFSEKYNLYSSFFDIDEYIMDIKNELRNNTALTEDEKIMFLSSATNTQRLSIHNTDANKKQLLYDFIITPLKQLDNLMNFLSHLRALFSNEIIAFDGYSINSSYHWDPAKSNTTLFTLPSNSQLLHHTNVSTSYSDNDASTYSECCLYGYIHKHANNNINNLSSSYVPFNDILVPHPYGLEYGYKSLYDPHDRIIKSISNNNPAFASKHLGIVYSTKDPSALNFSGYQQLPYQIDVAKDSNYFNTDDESRRLRNMLLHEYTGNSVVYNKNNPNSSAFLIDNVLFIDSQYHNPHSPIDDEIFIKSNSMRYGLLGDLPCYYEIDGKSILNYPYDPSAVTGRRKRDGVLLGPNGIYNGNSLRRFPLAWDKIHTTNLRLIAAWTPEDLAPNRLGLHEYPHIRQGHLQSRAYDSTYHLTEYLISKILKNAKLFDINSIPNIRSTYDVKGGNFINFSKVDSLIKEQIYNVTKLLNEFKGYIMLEYIHPCEFYLRSVQSEYNSLFISPVQDGTGTSNKVTIYDIQGRLNRFMSGTLTSKDINTNAKGAEIHVMNESELHLDPCHLDNDEALKGTLSVYEETKLLTVLNKMSAKMLIKLINPLVFSDEVKCSKIAPKSSRLAYLPHQQLGCVMNTKEQVHYGKLSSELNTIMYDSKSYALQSADVLYSEPNPRYCNFYFTNIVNQVNYIVGTLFKSANNTRDKKMYIKITELFKSHNEVLSSCIDTRFHKIKEINYLGDYGRTGHGGYFDRSLPFVLYNSFNANINEFIANLSESSSSVMEFITNYTTTNSKIKDSTAFRHLTLSSIDGVPMQNLMSSFITKPPVINAATASQYYHAANKTNSNIDIFEQGRCFKDTHEQMLPCQSSLLAGGQHYKIAKSHTEVLTNRESVVHYDQKLMKSFYGLCNIPYNSLIGRYTWYDILGRPSINGPLMNICVWPESERNKCVEDIVLSSLDLHKNSAITDINLVTNANIAKRLEPYLSSLSSARFYFSTLYGYGAINQTNMLYNDIYKYELSVVFSTSKPSKVTKFSVQHNTSDETKPPKVVQTSHDEAAATWLSHMSSSSGSKLQYNIIPATISYKVFDPNSYSINIVSSLLHARYSPIVIDKVSGKGELDVITDTVSPNTYIRDHGPDNSYMRFTTPLNTIKGDVITGSSEKILNRISSVDPAMSFSMSKPEMVEFNDDENTRSDLRRYKEYSLNNVVSNQAYSSFIETMTALMGKMNSRFPSPRHFLLAVFERDSGTPSCPHFDGLLYLIHSIAVEYNLLPKRNTELLQIIQSSNISESNVRSWIVRIRSVINNLRKQGMISGRGEQAGRRRSLLRGRRRHRHRVATNFNSTEHRIGMPITNKSTASPRFNNSSIILGSYDSQQYKTELDNFKNELSKMSTPDGVNANTVFVLIASILRLVDIDGRIYHNVKGFIVDSVAYLLQCNNRTLESKHLKYIKIALEKSPMYNTISSDPSCIAIMSLIDNMERYDNLSDSISKYVINGKIDPMHPLYHSMLLDQNGYYSYFVHLLNTNQNIWNGVAPYNITCGYSVIKSKDKHTSLDSITYSKHSPEFRISFMAKLYMMCVELFVLPNDMYDDNNINIESSSLNKAANMYVTLVNSSRPEQYVRSSNDTSCKRSMIIEADQYISKKTGGTITHPIYSSVRYDHYTSVGTQAADNLENTMHLLIGLCGEILHSAAVPAFRDVALLPSASPLPTEHDNMTNRLEYMFVLLQCIISHLNDEHGVKYASVKTKLHNTYVEFTQVMKSITRDYLKHIDMPVPDQQNGDSELRLLEQMVHKLRDLINLSLQVVNLTMTYLIPFFVDGDGFVNTYIRRYSIFNNSTDIIHTYYDHYNRLFTHFMAISMTIGEIIKDIGSVNFQTDARNIAAADYYMQVAMDLMDVVNTYTRSVWTAITFVGTTFSTDEATYGPHRPSRSGVADIYQIQSLSDLISKGAATYAFDDPIIITDGRTADEVYSTILGKDDSRLSIMPYSSANLQGVSQDDIDDWNITPSPHFEFNLSKPFLVPKNIIKPAYRIRTPHEALVPLRIYNDTVFDPAQHSTIDNFADITVHMPDLYRIIDSLNTGHWRGTEPIYYIAHTPRGIDTAYGLRDRILVLPGDDPVHTVAYFNQVITLTDDNGDDLTGLDITADDLDAEINDMGGIRCTYHDIHKAISTVLQGGIITPDTIASMRAHIHNPDYGQHRRSADYDIQIRNRGLGDPLDTAAIPVNDRPTYYDDARPDYANQTISDFDLRRQIAVQVGYWSHFVQGRLGLLGDSTHPTEITYTGPFSNAVTLDDHVETSRLSKLSNSAAANINSQLNIDEINGNTQGLRRRMKISSENEFGTFVYRPANASREFLELTKKIPRDVYLTPHDAHVGFGVHHRWHPLLGPHPNLYIGCSINAIIACVFADQFPNSHIPLLSEFFDNEGKNAHLEKPTLLSLDYTVYSKDHLRCGQFCASYNPLKLSWDVMQPLQHKLNDRTLGNLEFNQLEKIQIKKEGSGYVDIFHKLAYAKLITDLCMLDSSSKILELQKGNGTLYSLSLASAYSTPRNENYGSSLFEYRPSHLYHQKLEERLYVSQYVGAEFFCINPANSSFMHFNPMESVLSLDLGATGYWQPTGNHPVYELAESVISKIKLNTIKTHTKYTVNDGFFNMREQSDYGAITPANHEMYISVSMGFDDVFGLANGVLQPRGRGGDNIGNLRMHQSRFGEVKEIGVDPEGKYTMLTNRYPDAYVPLDSYLKGTSVLNDIEHLIKNMSKEIHNIIFNVSCSRTLDIDAANMSYLPNEVVSERISTKTIIKNALLATATCDARMGPYNVLSALDEDNTIVPKLSVSTNAAQVITGGAEAANDNGSGYPITSPMNSSILNIALNSPEEPIAVSFQDNNSELNGIILESYANVIRNTLMNHDSETNTIKKIIYSSIDEIGAETKVSITAAIPYILHEVSSLKSQTNLLQSYVSSNEHLGPLKNILLNNLRQSMDIAVVLENGLEAIKSEFIDEYIFGEQYPGHLGSLSKNASRRVANISFSAELYNYLSNCNEMIIRPLGDNNTYYKLNDLTKNSYSSFFKRLYALRKFYDESAVITCEDCPSVMKSISKLNLLLDKFTNKLDNKLVENIINSCKKIKFTPFEESPVNQFVCLTNNLYTTLFKDSIESCLMLRDSASAPLSSIQSKIIQASTISLNKFFNGRLTTSNDLSGSLSKNAEYQKAIKNMFSSTNLTPLNSLLFLQSDQLDGTIPTINTMFDDIQMYNNDIMYYDKYNSCYDIFSEMVFRKSNTENNGLFDIYKYKGNLYDPNNDNHYQLMVFNILDLNILPIDINALTREIPLFYVFNYSVSLDEFLSSSLEAYNIEIYNNTEANKRVNNYVNELNKYLLNICPDAKDYFISFDKDKKSLDVNKILFHNKHSHINPLFVNNVWADSSVKDCLLGAQLNDSQQLEYLNKYNCLINFISNAYVSTSSHKLNAVKTPSDSTIPYESDYIHHSYGLYFSGITPELSKTNQDYYKNVSYNESSISNFVYAPLNNIGSDTYMHIMNNTKYLSSLRSAKKILDTIHVKAFHSTDTVVSNSKFKKALDIKKDMIPIVNNIANDNDIRMYLSIVIGSSIDGVLGSTTMSLLDLFMYDENTPKAITNAPNESPIDDAVTDTEALHKAGILLASSGVYGSRRLILGNSSCKSIFNHPDVDHIIQGVGGKYKPSSLANVDIQHEQRMPNFYMNTFLKHNIYNCNYGISNNKEKGILYTCSIGRTGNMQNTSSVIYSSSDDKIHVPPVHEICPPNFEVNTCKNWLKLSAKYLKEYTYDLYSLISDNTNNGINDIIKRGLVNTDMTPFPHYFNNILMNCDKPSDNELYRRHSYSTLYNLSCVASQLNDSHIDSITRLNKLENANFMHTKLVEWIGSHAQTYKDAIRNRCYTSWGIVDPRSMSLLQTNEIIYKRPIIIKSSHGEYTVDEYCNALFMTNRGLAKRNANTPLDLTTGIGPSHDITDTSVAIARYNPTVLSRYPMSGSEVVNNAQLYKTCSSADSILNIAVTKDCIENTIFTSIIPNVSCINGEWMECNRSAKTPTSFKWKKIKSKCLLNHVLPYSDVGYTPIYSSIGNLKAFSANDPVLGIIKTNSNYIQGTLISPNGGGHTAATKRSHISNLHPPRHHFKNYSSLYKTFNVMSTAAGYSLAKHAYNDQIMANSSLIGSSVTEGICASDLYAAGLTQHDVSRKIHVLSHIMFNDKTFGYVPLRHITLLDIGYNLIRYKITQENLYTTNKVISGTLLYDSEYHNAKIYEDTYGTMDSSSGSIIKRSSIVPRVTAFDPSSKP